MYGTERPVESRHLFLNGNSITSRYSLHGTWPLRKTRASVGVKGALTWTAQHRCQQHRWSNTRAFTASWCSLYYYTSNTWCCCRPVSSQGPINRGARPCQFLHRHCEAFAFHRTPQRLGRVSLPPKNMSASRRAGRKDGGWWSALNTAYRTYMQTHGCKPDKTYIER